MPFSESTRQFINRDVLAYGDTSSQFWNAIITLAPIPEHPFNANALHRNLIGRSMPDRDTWWSTFIHTQYRRQSAIDRLLDWAWSPLKPKELETDSAILYATALAWLLPSSNRFLRDHATKSLVKVVGERSEILLDLIDKFRTVNDPYIVERICAVAYGCATKSNDKQKLTALAMSVYQWIFAASSPDTNILSRDYARGVVEFALRAGAQLPFDPDKARPPYKSAWPQTIPSKDELEAKYGWRKDQMPQGEWSRLAIYSSVMGFGDFARYVIGTNSGSFDWINIRLGKRPPVTARERHARFLNGLNSAQKRAWNAVDKIRTHNLFAGLLKNVADTPDQKTNRPARLPIPEEDVRKAEKAFEATLSRSELRTYRADVVTYLANPRIDEHRFDLSIAQRWILQRVFDLGWSVDKFGNFDRDVNAHLWRRDAKKAERIGKKYQWIAYHEFLGLVADNFEFGSPLFDDSPRKYCGPWQTFERDIDPTCALLGIAGGDKQQDSWWSRRKAYRWDADNHSNTWIRTRQDLPLVEPMIEVVNPEDGSVWLVLETYPEWREPVPAFKDEFEDRRRWLWYQLRSFVIDHKGVTKAFSHLSKQNFWGRWMPENPDYHATFLGEFYWAPALAEFDPILDPRKEKDPRLNGIGSAFIFTSGSYYSQMNSFDCSVDEGFHIFLPGQWLVKNMNLQWNGSEGRFFDSDGNLIAFDPAVSQPGPNALLIHKERFLSFLRASGYEVVWFLLGGKQELGGSWGRDEREGELQISGVYRMKGDKVSGKLRPKFVSFKR